MRNKKLIVLISIFVVLTLLIVISSVAFSVQNVYASCYNYEDNVYDETIASKEINGIANGKSIFLLNEQKTIETIEKNCSDVKVINIERKFPNQVYINYVRVFPYLVFETDDFAFYTSNTGKVLSKSDKQSKYLHYIKLITLSAPSSTSIGDMLYNEDADEYDFVSSIMNTIERLDLKDVMVDMFELIDLSYIDNTNTVPCVYMKTRTGTCFELQGDATNMDKKIRLAISIYLSNETKYMHGGTLIVNTSGSGASYSSVNRYENAKNQLKHT